MYTYHGDIDLNDTMILCVPKHSAYWLQFSYLNLQNISHKANGCVLWVGELSSTRESKTGELSYYQYVKNGKPVETLKVREAETIEPIHLNTLFYFHVFY